MKIKDWWQELNLTEKQRALVSTGVARIAKETTKAYLLEYKKNQDSTMFWCPKSVIGKVNQEDEKDNFEYGRMLWYGHKNKVPGVTVGCGLSYEDVKKRVTIAGYK